MSTTLLATLWILVTATAYADPECLICNVDYADSQKVESCDCGILEYCNKTAGSCKFVDGKRICTGGCYGRSMYPPRLQPSPSPSLNSDGPTR